MSPIISFQAFAGNLVPSLALYDLLRKYSHEVNCKIQELTAPPSSLQGPGQRQRVAKLLGLNTIVAAT